MVRSVLLGAFASPLLAAPAPTPRATRTLFDGRSTQGWRHAGGARFEVRDGTLRTAPGNGLGVLYYARERYRDFVLRLRFRAAEGANSGVHLRFPKPGADAARGSTAATRCRSTTPPPTRAGRARSTASPTSTRPARGSSRAGTWSTLTIRVEGQTYTVYRDGRRINRYTASRRRSGYIGLQAHGGAQDVVAFRAIRIREL